MRAARPPVVVLAVLLAGCGTGLYDAAGVPAPPAGRTCDAGQVVCANVCTDETAVHCGSGCEDCTAAGTPPLHGAFACLAGGLCGYVCGDGWLKCEGGCCGATALAAGSAFTCALLDDGTLRCWGANGAGQLGDGSTTRRPEPARPTLPAAATAIGAGADHACAVLAGGAVSCWGANDAGQVTGTTTSAPVLVPGPSPVSSGATAIAAGADHTCALLSTGAVTCWGSDADGRLGPGPGAPIASGATAIAAGASHTCAVVAGAVKCWGANGAGQLGDGTTAPRVGAVVTTLPSGIVDVAASADQSCASTGISNDVSGIDDVVRCWGDSLGPGFLFSSPQPVPEIPRRSDGSQSTVRYDVSRIAAGRRHVCVGRKAEAVECFGAESLSGQLGGTPLDPGSAVSVPLLPVTVPAVVALASGADHACAALGDGRLRCWGANAQGQLGDGTVGDPGVGAIRVPSGR